MQDSFLPAGKPFDTLISVGKVLDQAKSDVLIIDPYADKAVLEHYAVLAPELVRVRLLVSEKYKPSLKPAARTWMQQYGVKRPLEIRIAPPRKLHDRHIIVDGTDVWTLGQSFNALAQHSPTGITKTVDPQTAADKREAYEDIWKTAVPMPDA
jgi:hypothetical protein